LFCTSLLGSRFLLFKKWVYPQCQIFGELVLELIKIKFGKPEFIRYIITG